MSSYCRQKLNHHFGRKADGIFLGSFFRDIFSHLNVTFNFNTQWFKLASSFRSISTINKFELIRFEFSLCICLRFINNILEAFKEEASLNNKFVFHTGVGTTMWSLSKEKQNGFYIIWDNNHISIHLLYLMFIYLFTLSLFT